MSTTERDDGVLAAEYVLGLLEPKEMAAAEQRLATDAAFARAVEAWRVRFAELDQTADVPALDERVWSNIESGLGSAHDARASAPSFIDRLRPLWDSLPAWRAATFAAAAAVLVMAVGLTAALRDARRAPVFVAVLIKEGGTQPGAVVNAFADGRAELIPLENINVPPGRALEIWTLWDRSVGPRSVGLIDQARTTRLNLQNLPRTGPNQLFEITLEPATGSPIGRPTGPILFKGTTSQAL